MSWLSQLFHPRTPYQNASNTSQGYYNQGQGYLDPYNQNGVNAGKDLNTARGKLLNPAGLQDEWSKTYAESEHAKQLEKEAADRGLGAASSMGLMGSSSALQNQQTTGTNIVNADKQKYMDDLMQKYMQGIGLGENQYGVGAGAAGHMSNNANDQGTTQANLGFGSDTAGPNMITGALGAIMKMIQQMMSGGVGAGGTY